jgi:hypothetical protein
MSRYYRKLLMLAVAAVLCCAAPVLAGEFSEFAADDPAPAAPAPERAPPLPFHSIEGVGGGAITPIAYLVNPGKEDEIFGKPAFAMSYVGLGSKNLTALTVTETVFQRIELGYAADRLGLGSLPSDIRDATTIDVDRSDVWLHHFNVRGLLVKENTELGGIKLPAVTLGVDVKTNDGIRKINQKLGGALEGIGYQKENGEDFTLTLTKMFPKFFGRPLIVTAGLRESQAANLGFLGFSSTYRASFEGSIVYIPVDGLVVAYEFRQKNDPYSTIPGLINGEDNWHAFDVGLILTPQSTLVVGYGNFGTLANSEANGAWWFQLKHEF